MDCSIHPQKEAIGACVRCGNLFCDDCLIEIDGKRYCKEHVLEILENDKFNKRHVNHNTGHIYEYNYRPAVYYRPKDRLIAFLLCIIFGIAGFHRFYVGKIGTGLIYMFTGGLFGIGWIIDIITIITGSFTDEHGNYLR